MATYQRPTFDIVSKMRDGVVVELSFSRWRATESAELADLGLTGGAVVEQRVRDYLRIGSLSLLPKEFTDRANTIEHGGHRRLRRLSFEMLGRYFVPVTAWPAWQAEYARIESDWQALAAEMVTRWDEMTLEVAGAYDRIARTIYREQRAQIAAVGQYATEDAFAAAYVERVLARRGTAEAAAARWSVTATYTPLTGADSYRESAIGEASRQAAAIVAAAQDEAGAMESARAGMLADMAASMNQQRAAAMEQFLQTVIGSIHEIVYDTMTTNLKTVVENNAMRPATGKSLRAFIEQAPVLMFAEDPAVSAMLTRLSAMVEGFGDRTPATVAALLRACAIVARGRLVEIGADLKPAPLALGVPNNPTPADIESALGVLGFATESPIIVTLPDGGEPPAGGSIEPAPVTITLPASDYGDGRPAGGLAPVAPLAVAAMPAGSAW